MEQKHIHLPVQDVTNTKPVLHMCRDVSLKHKPSFSLQHSKASFMTDKLWQNGITITVGFIGGVEWQWAWIAKVVTESIMVYANLNFQFNFNPSQAMNCNIRIAFDAAEGCYSYMGTDALDYSLYRSNTMNFGWMDAPYNTTFSFNGTSYTTPTGFDQGGYPGLGTTIIHEFGHVCGMIHEHQSPFNNPFVWNTKALYAIFEGPPNDWTKAMIDSNIINRYSTTNMNGSDFDASSIMKYSFPSYLLLNPSSAVASYIQQFNTLLSSCDQYWLSQNYPGRPVSVSCVLNHPGPVPPAPTPTPTPTPPPNPTPTPPTNPNLKSSSIWVYLIIIAVIVFILCFMAM
jgi:hypothetical protein